MTEANAPRFDDNAVVVRRISGRTRIPRTWRFTTDGRTWRVERPDGAITTGHATFADAAASHPHILLVSRAHVLTVTTGGLIQPSDVVMLMTHDFDGSEPRCEDADDWCDPNDESWEASDESLDRPLTHHSDFGVLTLALGLGWPDSRAASDKPVRVDDFVCVAARVGPARYRMVASTLRPLKPIYLEVWNRGVEVWDRGARQDAPPGRMVVSTTIGEIVPGVVCRFFDCKHFTTVRFAEVTEEQRRELDVWTERWMNNDF